MTCEAVAGALGVQGQHLGFELADIRASLGDPRWLELSGPVSRNLNPALAMAGTDGVYTI